jgi:hypothetical protein
MNSERKEYRERIARQERNIERMAQQEKNIERGWISKKGI